MCLFDLDGTLANHDGALIKDMSSIMSPNELPFVRKNEDEKEPAYIKERIRLIRSQRNWWENLDILPLGFAIYEMARKIGFQIHVLTKGPWSTPYGWSEKVIWVRKHLHEDVKICLVEDKSIVYGRILVDDYPPYVKDWLKYRPRGLVIMPAHPYNEQFKHPQVIRCDGSNMNDVSVAMIKAYERQ